MKSLIIIVFLMLFTWVAVADAQTRCTYRCAGRVCWVECS